MATGEEGQDLRCSWATGWIQTVSKSLLPARFSRPVYHLYFTIKSNLLIIIQCFMLVDQHGFSGASG